MARVCRSGEISTLALSPSGRFVAAASGESTPTLVYDLICGLDGSELQLWSQVPGHEGGVQALTFLDDGTIASLGLEDGLICVHELATGSLICSTVLPTGQLVLTSSLSSPELSAGGAGGLLSWRVEGPVDGLEEGKLQLLQKGTKSSPLLLEGVQVTALVYLEESSAAPQSSGMGSSSLLSGDSAGNLLLWTSSSIAAAAWSCAPAFAEIDLLHASLDTSQPEATRWSIVAAGAGPACLVQRYRLTLVPGVQPELELISETALDGAALGMSWASGASQGVVGTSGGMLWHVHWDSMSTTTLVSAVAPPLVQLATPYDASILATLSSADVEGERCGVLLWSTGGQCRAPIARIHMPHDAATCVSLSGDGPAMGTLVANSTYPHCVIGHQSGALRLVSLRSLEVVANAQPHMAAVCCIQFCASGPMGNAVISAAADGEVRLIAIEDGANGLAAGLVHLALLRPATGVRVHCLDVLPSTSFEGGTHWLVILGTL